MTTSVRNFLSAAQGDHVLADLFQEITDRLQAGESVDLEACILEHPERADELRRVLPAIEMLVKLGMSTGARHGQAESPSTASAASLGTLGDFRLIHELGRGGMSPEQALAKRVVVDHRTDIYSLGATLYELLTLQPVFLGHDRQEVLRQIAFEEPQPLRKLNPAIPADLETIVLKATAKNPADRYATAQEFADDLTRYLEDKAILARRPGPISRLVKWSLRHKPFVWSAAAATVAAFVVLAGSIGWIVSDRDWRQSATEREVTQAVQHAEQLMSRTSWLEAKSALSRADGLLVTGRANDELRERVQQLHRDLAMLDRLNDIREADASMLDGVHDYALLDQRYEQAFREYGIEPLPGGWWSSPRDPSSSSTANLNPAADPGSRRLDPSHLVLVRAAELIECRTIQHELIAALDHWSVVRRRASEPGVSRILAVARAADSDDLRNRIRDCLERNDREELFDASSSAELASLPTATAVLLASALYEAGDRERAVTVLRIAQHRNPSDRGVNLLLAENLHDLSRWDEMQHFAGVAHALRPTGGAARLAVADALRHKGSLDESASLCEEVIQLNADNPHAYHMLGLVREDQTEWSDAATQFRHAIELHPAYVEAHNHLGRCLTRQGEIDAAIAALQRAIELKPTYAGPHENLGVALWRKGQFDEAIAELHKAIELDPNSAQAHTDLGAILVRRGQVTTGIEEHRRAIALNPNSAEAHINLGNAFRLQNDLDSAAAEYRTAIDLKPHLAAPRWNLAQTLLDQAKFAEALVQLQYGHDMSLRDRYGPYPWTARLRECERMLELEGRLPAVLAGSEPVANAAERADFGMLCYSKRLYATAARFYEQAFAADPALAEDAEHPRRYSAACSAALAGCGQGDDADTSKLDDTERHRLRQQALDWLRAELSRHATALQSGDPRIRQAALTQLRHSLVDPDLACVRQSEALSAFAESKRAEWSNLWDGIRRVIERPK